MSGLDALFADLWSGLTSEKPADFQAFPGDKKPKLESQAIDNIDISSVSRISSPEKEGKGIPALKSAQAGAGGRGRAGARDTVKKRLEILETLENPLPAEGCISSYPSRNLEIKRESGKLRPLPAASPGAALRPQPLPPSDGRALLVWRAGLYRLSPDRIPCPGYTSAGWAATHARALAFLDAFGEQAGAMGWTAIRLFSVHPEAGIVRVDACGGLVLPIGGRVRAITADTISFGHLTHREKPGQRQGVLIWDLGR